MAETAYFTKRRFFWQPDAWRLLREVACVEYARRVVPASVAGIRIEFPETRVKYGVRIAIITRMLAGESFLDLLYDPGRRQCAIEIGVVALEAWQRAQVTDRPFIVFSTIFRWVKAPRALLRARYGATRLDRPQQRELRQMVARYLSARDAEGVLVHGDLHPSHLIVDLAHSSLGFVDLEATHTGKAATNLAQLWIGYHYADRELGRAFYCAYCNRFPDSLTEQFDNDLRVELVIRCQTHIREGVRTGNRVLENQARSLLADLLHGVSFASTCLEGSICCT